MSNASAITVMPQEQNKAISPIMIFKNDLMRMKGDIAAMLPSQIPVDRFIRTAITAVSMDQDLLKADKKSLIMACMNAAKDGLLPDKKEAAFVIFNTKEKDVWVKKVQYMPMVQGLIKKLRQSGELAGLSVQVVYEKDKFTVIKGDNERIEHEPYLEGDAGNVKFAYAIAKLKDGTVQREVMTKAQLEKVKSVSKVGTGESVPWVKWYDEMARKSVLRRLMKFLPSSTDIEDTIKADNETYDFDGSFVDVSEGIPEQPKITGNPLDVFAGSDKVPDDKSNEQSTTSDVATQNQAAASSPAPEKKPIQLTLIGWQKEINNSKTLEEALAKATEAKAQFTGDTVAINALNATHEKKANALKKEAA